MASYAYRTRGNTNLVTLGFGFPYKEVNIDLTASHHKSKGDNSETYKGWQIPMTRGLVLF